MGIRAVEVRDGAAIADDVTLKAPLLQPDLQEICVCARRHAINAAVSAHDRIYTALPYAGAKSRQVGFVQIAFARLDVEFVAFRSGLLCTA